MKEQVNILVVDDEKEVCNFFHFLLSEKGYRVVTACSGKELNLQLPCFSFTLALIDLRLPDTDGIKLMEQIKTSQPECRVIIMTGYSTVKTAVDAIKLGAYDYVEKPFEDIEELERLIDTALQTDKKLPEKDLVLVEELAEHGIICSQASPLLKTLTLAEKISGKNITVLIQGDTGVGKEVLARFIHSRSARANDPFIAVNCAAFTESLLESELFGHEKGSFTGAHNSRKGIFQIANGGTLFLDEVGDASPAIQVKLLRVLESGEYMPVGGERFQRTDVRIIAATNIPLAEAVATRKFREDLFYRLNVVNLEIPPLRERKCDIELLAYYFASRLYSLDATGEITIQPKAMELLLNYTWPGNVRELANVMARAVVLAEDGEITSEGLPDKINCIKELRTPQWPDLPTSEAVDQMISQYAEILANKLAAQTLDLNDLTRKLKDAQYNITKQVVQEELVRNNGNRNEAAAKLSCSTRVLRYYLNERG